MAKASAHKWELRSRFRRHAFGCKSQPAIKRFKKAVSEIKEVARKANSTPCSPQTLTRAARDFAEKNPTSAIEAGMAALRWLVEGYGYEVTGLDVLNADSHTMKAAENAGCGEQIRGRIHDLVSRESSGERFVTKVLGRHLELS